MLNSYPPGKFNPISALKAEDKFFILITKDFQGGKLFCLVDKGRAKSRR